MLHGHQNELKMQVESLKYSKLGDSENRKQVDDLENLINKGAEKYEKNKDRFQRY